MMLMCDYSELRVPTSRKFAKTCVEKKRRDRINRSLDELKELMAVTDEKARYQKLEKAEILEMTVTYIRNLKSTINHYENGYQYCSEEIWKLIHSCPNLCAEQREHLAECCKQIWTHRRRGRPPVHPYRQRPSGQQRLQLLINDSCSSSSSGASSHLLSPSSAKLWKPYM